MPTRGAYAGLNSRCGYSMGQIDSMCSEPEYYECPHGFEKRKRFSLKCIKCYRATEKKEKGCLMQMEIENHHSKNYVLGPHRYHGSMSRDD